MERIIFEESMEGVVIDEVVRDEGFSMTMKHFHDTYELYFLLKWRTILFH